MTELLWTAILHATLSDKKREKASDYIYVQYNRAKSYKEEKKDPETKRG